MSNFFVFCSGVHPTFLKRCPADKNKYVGIGATIFFTGLLAYFSSFYAFYTVFNNGLVAFLLGLVWGLMIFNLDRYIVSTMSKTGSAFNQWLMAMPRLLFAVLIAIVISKPIEMKLFQSEIDNEIVSMEQKAYAEQEALLTARYVDREQALKSRREEILQEANKLQKYRDELNAEALAEADGTGGSQIRNLGPIYRAKKAKADQAHAEYTTFLDENKKELDQIYASEKTLKLEKSAAIANLEKVDLRGFASRLKALHLAGQREGIIAIASIFITLLFIALESAPVFVKLIARKGPVDYVAAKHHARYVFSHDQVVHSHAIASDYRKKTKNYATTKAIEQENMLLQQTLEAESDKYRREGASWENLREWRKAIESHVL